MFERFKWIARRFSLFGLILLITCESNFLIPFTPVDSFYLEYHVTGGIGGVNNVLVIENESFSYSSRNYNFTGLIDENHRYKILNGLFSSNFFLLREEYFYKQKIADVLTFSFIFQSENISKKVTGHGGILPKTISNLISIMDTIIEDLKTTITTGKVIPYRNWILEEWPFSDQVKLSENVHNKVLVGKEIFDHFKERILQGLKIVYLENGLFYTIVTNGAFGIPYEDHNEFYIESRDPKEPFRWLPTSATTLADIPPEGVMVYDEDYRRIRNFYEINYSPRFIIDEDLKLGIPVYDFWLYHGNNYR